MNKWFKKFLTPTTSSQKTDDLEKLVFKNCASWKVLPEVKTLTLTEDFKNETTIVDFEFALKEPKKELKLSLIRGMGQGIVDAVWNSIIKELNQTYISLNGLSFKEFEIRALTKEKNLDHSKTNAAAVAKLIILNAHNDPFEFNAEGFSIVAATIKVVERTISLFINAEIAMLRTYFAYKDAVERRRTDLVEKYQLQMAELVKITSYEQALKSKYPLI